MFGIFKFITNWLDVLYMAPKSRRTPSFVSKYSIILVPTKKQKINILFLK